MVSERTNRQDIIPNWIPERLTNLRVVLIGNDRLSDFILADLISIGVGDIRRIGKSYFFEFEKMARNDARDEEVDKVVQKEDALHNQDLAKIYLMGANFVIDATNNKDSKIYAGQIAKDNKIDYISCSSGNDGFSFYIEDRELEDSQYVQKQGLVNSMVCAAMVVDEMRKRLFQLKGDIKSKSFIYSVKEPQRFDKKVIQVGAGGIGTASAIALANLGVDLTIVDFDSIEKSNLNRQFLFYNSSGLKSIILADRLKKYSEKVRGLEGKIGENFNPSGYDFIFSCVDNLEARYYMNQASMKYGIPLINGGCGIYSGEAEIFIPGKTACLDCQLGGEPSAFVKIKKESKEDKGLCAISPALVSPNQITGGLMLYLLDKGLRGEYRRLDYSSGIGDIIYETSPVTKCSNKCKNS